MPSKCPQRNASTWSPKVCKTMALVAAIVGLGLLFYILLGFRYALAPALASSSVQPPGPGLLFGWLSK